MRTPDTKTYLITTTERNRRTGRTEAIVSHGIGNNTMKNYILSQDPLHCYAPQRDAEGPYILADNQS